jgi:hypothetical protein
MEGALFDLALASRARRREPDSLGSHLLSSLHFFFERLRGRVALPLTRADLY